MAKYSALHKIMGNSPAIDDVKRPFSAAHLVNRTRCQLFACAAFADDKRSGFARRNRFDNAVYGLHGH